MGWIKRITYNDGGRRAAGFKTCQVGDCVNRALAIVTGVDYMLIRRLLIEACMRERGADRSHPETGVYPRTYGRLLKSLGAGNYTKINSWDQLPPVGRCLVVLEGHVVAYVDGVFHDTYDPIEKSADLQGYYHFG